MDSGRVVLFKCVLLIVILRLSYINHCCLQLPAATNISEFASFADNDPNFSLIGTKFTLKYITVHFKVSGESLPFHHILKLSSATEA